MVIGIISDTHGLLRPEAKDNLKDCNLIIHGGDIGKLKVIEELEEITKAEFIKGNCDKGVEFNQTPDTKIINIDDSKIYIVHDISKIDIDLEKGQIDIVIYGHSHKSNIYKKDGILYINPGSVGPRRFKLPTTMAKLYIGDNKDYNVDLITLNN